MSAITSVRLEPVGGPTAPPPKVDSDVVTYQCLNLKVRGVVELGTPAAGAAAMRETLFPRPYPSPVGVGWRSGWIQLCCQEEIWALYRGKTPSEGTMLAKWQPGAALDMASSDTRDLFVTMSGNFYRRMSPASPTAVVEFEDLPIQQFRTSLFNRTTMKQNDLAVAVTRLSFILALAARDPDDHLHLLKHIYWWVRWESTFKAGTAGKLVETPVASKTEAGKSNPHDGAPLKLVQALGGPGGPSANMVAANAVETCYPRWQDLANLRPVPEAPAAPKPKPKPKL